VRRASASFRTEFFCTFQVSIRTFATSLPISLDLDGLPALCETSGLNVCPECAPLRFYVKLTGGAPLLNYLYQIKTAPPGGAPLLNYLYQIKTAPPHHFLYSFIPFWGRIGLTGVYFTSKTAFGLFEAGIRSDNSICVKNALL
jgi:hypothetical protein